MYILPNEHIRNRVVTSRVDPMVGFSSLYRQNIRQSKSIQRRVYIPENIRKAVFRRDSNHCQNCKSNQNLQIDHIIPISDGGLDDAGNLQTLCMACNIAKGGNRSKGIDSTSLKSIFGGKWNYVGSNSANTFFEFDADVLIYDEFNQCDQKNLLIAKQRTGAAEREIWLKIGNPTIPGFGIDAAYEDSTKAVWMVKCPHCTKEQVLDWWKNFIDRDDSGHYFLRDKDRHTGTGRDASAICQFCFKPIDRLSKGEWVEAHPGHPIHGYAASALFGRPGNDNFESPRPIIREMFDDWIKAQSNQTALEIFYNQQLGLPYSAEGSHISLSMLAACTRDYTMPLSGANTVAGMDVGGVHHLHISQLVKDKDGRRVRQKVFASQVPSWEEADRICRLYGVAYGVLDAQGEIHAQRQWCDAHPGWYRCYYSLGRENVKEAETISHAEQTIRVNRTESLDASYADYANQLVNLPKDYASMDSGDFVSQMTAAVRQIQESANGVKRYVWDEKGKPDHHQHADNYERIAASLYVDPESLITII